MVHTVVQVTLALGYCDFLIDEAAENGGCIPYDLDLYVEVG